MCLHPSAPTPYALADVVTLFATLNREGVFARPMQEILEAEEPCLRSTRC